MNNSKKCQKCGAYYYTELCSCEKRKFIKDFTAHAILDHRKIRFERSNIKDSIPKFGGRPDREQIIQDDDITNLRIALNQNISFEEFLNLI